MSTMARMTEKHMRAKVDIVNKLLGFPTDSDEPVGWSREPGTISLSSAYGGWTVHYIDSNIGGLRDLMGGHGPARECAEFLNGMMEALRIVRDK